MTTTQLVEIHVGYQDTKDPAGRYTRWTEDATGHTYWTFPIQLDRVYPIETIADAVFAADNGPDARTGDPRNITGAIQDQMLVAYEMTQERHHSLSVGDRVRVGEVEVICASFGWARVPRVIPPLPAI